jgi:hypothetical protein
MAKKSASRSKKQAGARLKDLKSKKNPKGGVGALGYSVFIPQGVPSPPPSTPKKS